ncbi:hypothetical protein [Microbacterium sp. CJ88]|uniref:hypothetical protein n=1 Tax=Microbacterium sp. CJ88 TaxID=3445672 RepID=UPI003F659347
MADDLDIRGGGAVSVDSVTLREAAGGFAGVGGELDEVATVLGSAGALVAALPRDAWVLSSEIAALAARVRDASAGAGAFDRELREAAAVYELVELSAQRAVAEAGGDTARVDAIDAQIDRIVRDHPGARLSAAVAVAADELTWPGEFAGQAVTGWWGPSLGMSPFLGTGIYGVAQLLRRTGAGVVRPGDRLTSNATPVTMTTVHRSSATAPRSLADMGARIPGGGGPGRVRVERYAMPDGSRQFVVYVAGTQAMGRMGGSDPFDQLSNVQLYSGAASASYQATTEALRLSGAQPGDVVHTAGHSQGAMINAHLAVEGDYDTRTVVSFGSPVDADVGEGTLSVSLRHTDDAVPMLQGGGHSQAVGAPGSFVAERVADPAGGPRDLQVPAHAMAAYIETARMLDSSADPRMDGVRALFDELGAATSVTAVEYGAERVLPQPQPSPAPSPFPAGPPPVSPANGGGGV